MVYITKYITKSVARDRLKGEHIFYCSNGLNKPMKSIPIKFDYNTGLDFDFQNDLIKVKKYNNVEEVTKILQEYYKSLNKTKLIDKLKNQ